MNLKLTDYESLDINALPEHVAIIMDGNGRWAKKRLKNRIIGHEKGADTVRNITRLCRNLGIKVLTLYAFSTENWQRPEKEVSALMLLLKKFLISERKLLHDNNIRLKAIGQIERLPKKVREALDNTIDDTSKNDSMILNLALSYGSRNEIVSAVKQISKHVKESKIEIDDINEQLFSDYLYTKQMPDPDLLIRTSGEMRLSNFMLWQMAYTEIYITKTLWPDFEQEEFINILKDYQSRERRFGKTSDQKINKEVK